MTETGRFPARPWTPEDDEVLRSLALNGVDARGIGNRVKSNRGCCAVSRQEAEHSRKKRSDGEALDLDLQG